MKKSYGEQKVFELIVKTFQRKYNFNLKFSEKRMKSFYYKVKCQVYLINESMFKHKISRE